MNRSRFGFRVAIRQPDGSFRRFRVYTLDMAGVICDGSGSLPPGKLTAYYIDTWPSGVVIDGENAVLEQCTGQSDQSGRLIFENDVVEVYDLLTDCWNRSIVRWTDECGGGWICAYAEPEQVVHGCSLASPSGTCLDGALCRLVSHEEGVRNENQG